MEKSSINEAETKKNSRGITDREGESLTDKKDAGGERVVITLPEREIKRKEKSGERYILSISGLGISISPPEPLPPEKNGGAQNEDGEEKPRASLSDFYVSGKAIAKEVELKLLRDTEELISKEASVYLEIEKGALESNNAEGEQGGEEPNISDEGESCPIYPSDFSDEPIYGDKAPSPYPPILPYPDPSYPESPSAEPEYFDTGDTEVIYPHLTDADIYAMGEYDYFLRELEIRRGNLGLSPAYRYDAEEKYKKDIKKLGYSEFIVKYGKITAETRALQKLIQSERAFRDAGKAPDTLYSVYVELSYYYEAIALSLDLLCLSASVGASEKSAGVAEGLKKLTQEYNFLVEYYNSLSGEKNELMDESAITSAMRGEWHASVPRVFYSGFFVGGASGASAADKKKSSIDFLLQLEREKKLRESSGKATLPISKERRFVECERDITLIRERYSYLILKKREERDFIDRSFSPSRRKRRRAKGLCDRDMRRLVSKLSASVRDETADNKRYYSLVTVGETIPQYKKKCDVAELLSLRMKILSLLSERDKINEKLISLYTGGSAKRVFKGAMSARMNAVRRAKSGQRYIAKEANNLHAPRYLLEKLYHYLNLRCEISGMIAEDKYKKRRGGLSYSERREVKGRISKNRVRLKGASQKVKYYMKKIKSSGEEREENYRWVIWVVSTLLFAGLFFLVYFLLGEDIIKFIFGKEG